jgi:hypothetical protein
VAQAPVCGGCAEVGNCAVGQRCLTILSTHWNDGMTEHERTYQYWISQACLSQQLSEMMDKIAGGPTDVKKSVRSAEELP